MLIGSLAVSGVIAATGLSSHKTGTESAVARWSKSVVELRCVDALGESLGGGSGTFIQYGGTIVILSADHVFEMCPTRVLDLPEYPGAILRPLKIDAHHDLILLSIEGLSGLGVPAIPLAIHNESPGNDVYVVGFPGSTNTRTITKGIVEAYFNRSDAFLGKLVRELMIIDATIFFGNSGGAVFNRQGELIGVVHGVIREMGYQAGLITPIDDVLKFLSTPT